MSGTSLPDIHPTLKKVLFLQRTIGNLAKARLIRAKLKVGQPGVKYEQEADRVADTGMIMSDCETWVGRATRVFGPIPHALNYNSY